MTDFVNQVLNATDRAPAEVPEGTFKGQTIGKLNFNGPFEFTNKHGEKGTVLQANVAVVPTEMIEADEEVDFDEVEPVRHNIPLFGSADGQPSKRDLRKLDRFLSNLGVPGDNPAQAAAAEGGLQGYEVQFAVTENDRGYKEATKVTPVED